MRQAAAHGHRQAQYELGSYLTLDGPAQDYEQAAVWLHRSAQQGYPPAQLSLGMLYATGQGVAPDFAQALAWIRLARAGGDELAGDIEADLREVITAAERTQADRLFGEYLQELSSER